MSWPSVSTVAPTSTSELTPLRSLDRASFMVLSVVIWTLHLYFLAKLLTTSWLMYATHVYTCRVASFSVSRLLAMAALSGGRGQVTGWLGRGSGTAPEPASAG